MNRTDFILKFREANDKIDNEWILNVLNRSIEASKEENELYNLIITNEELAELTQEVSKYLRHKGDYYNILQELADVMICKNYIQMLCGISDEDLNKAINVKTKRIEDQLNKTGEYK